MAEDDPENDPPTAELPPSDAPAAGDAPADDALADVAAPPDVATAADAATAADGDAPAEAPRAEEEEDDLAAVGDRDAVFEALWKRVLEAWDDDKPHAALLEHAIKSEKLPDLAGRYRALQDDPDKGERAKKKIDGIVVAATHMLMATKTPPRTKTPWQWSAAAALIFAIVCTWLFYQLFVPHR